VFTTYVTKSKHVRIIKIMNFKKEWGSISVIKSKETRQELHVNIGYCI